MPIHKYGDENHQERHFGQCYLWTSDTLVAGGHFPVTVLFHSIVSPHHSAFSNLKSLAQDLDQSDQHRPSGARGSWQPENSFYKCGWSRTGVRRIFGRRIWDKMGVRRQQERVRSEEQKINIGDHMDRNEGIIHSSIEIRGVKRKRWKNRVNQKL